MLKTERLKGAARFHPHTRQRSFPEPFVSSCEKDSRRRPLRTLTHTPRHSLLAVPDPARQRLSAFLFSLSVFSFSLLRLSAFQFSAFQLFSSAPFSFQFSVFSFSLQRLSAFQFSAFQLFSSAFQFSAFQHFSFSAFLFSFQLFSSTLSLLLKNNTPRSGSCEGCLSVRLRRPAYCCGTIRVRKNCPLDVANVMFVSPSTLRYFSSFVIPAASGQTFVRLILESIRMFSVRSLAEA